MNDTSTDRAFCERMLPGVSRTFALTIRLLPPGLEYPVLVAYLLCRVADTIEDSTLLPVALKVSLLEHFRTCLDDDGPDAAALHAAFAGTSDEETLAREADIVLREFRRLPGAQRAAIRPWVQEMCTGMASFVAAGGSEGSGRLQMLASVEELERYCYFVAGTVGHLLTALFRLHDGEMTEAQYQRLESLATSFGLGLQMTNIVKDVADDRGRGVSFVPRELFETSGIKPEDLPAAARDGLAGRVMQPLIARARRHLASALDYCTTLPRRQYRIRLFCLTSLYFAARTLRLARREPALLGGERKIKISRGAVYRTLAMTYLVAPVDALVRAYFVRLEGAG
ncbi:MAG TPA: phytoene/squalene synthase family protein [Gemmatimonadales bacterium]